MRTDPTPKKGITMKKIITAIAMAGALLLDARPRWGGEAPSRKEWSK